VQDRRQGENKSNFSQEDIRFTLRPGSGQATKDGVLYAFVLAPPTEDIVITTLATGGLLEQGIASLELMGSSAEIKWERTADALTIRLPGNLPGEIVNGFRIHLD
jgi:alpha-L-fucosidase